jgi:hypothetical protein
MTDFLARTDWAQVNASVNTYSIPFPYLAEGHVYVYTRATGDDTSIPEVYTGTVTFLDSSLVTLSPALVDETKDVQFRRITPSDDLLTRFETPGPIDKDELNNALLQLLYIVQEAYDLALSIQDDLALLSSIVAEILAALLEIRSIASAIAYQYDIIAAVPYSPVVGSQIGPIPIVRPLTLLATAPGSRGWALQPLTSGTFTLNIQKNLVTVGTIVWTATEDEPTFTVVSDVSFATTDILTLEVDASSTTFEQFGVTLKMHREGDLS